MALRYVVYINFIVTPSFKKQIIFVASVDSNISSETTMLFS